MKLRKEMPRLIGFEELGNEDAFDTAVLELRLFQSGTSLMFWISGHSYQCQAVYRGDLKEELEQQFVTTPFQSVFQ